MSEKSWVFQDGRQDTLWSNAYFLESLLQWFPHFCLRLSHNETILPGQPWHFIPACFWPYWSCFLSVLYKLSQWAHSYFKILYGNYILQCLVWPLWPTEVTTSLLFLLLLLLLQVTHSILDAYLHIYFICWMLELVRNRDHVSFITVSSEAKKPFIK